MCNRQSKYLHLNSFWTMMILLSGCMLCNGTNELVQLHCSSSPTPAAITAEPTEESSRRTASPSTTISRAPSMDPTLSPSATPSYPPSMLPTFDPSPIPTTLQPTAAPVLVRTNTPTISSTTSSWSPTPAEDKECEVLRPDWIGDGWCDSSNIGSESYNSEACAYDGGDCCEVSCHNNLGGGRRFQCGTNGYHCIDTSAATNYVHVNFTSEFILTNITLKNTVDPNGLSNVSAASFHEIILDGVESLLQVDEITVLSYEFGEIATRLSTSRSDQESLWASKIKHTASSAALDRSKAIFGLNSTEINAYLRRSSGNGLLESLIRLESIERNFSALDHVVLCNIEDTSRCTDNGGSSSNIDGSNASDDVNESTCSFDRSHWRNVYLTPWYICWIAIMILAWMASLLFTIHDLAKTTAGTTETRILYYALVVCCIARIVYLLLLVAIPNDRVPHACAEFIQRWYRSHGPPSRHLSLTILFTRVVFFPIFTAAGISIMDKAINALHHSL